MFKEHIDLDYQELIPRFMELKKEEMNEVKKYLKQGNYEKLKFLGHRIKGSGENYGFIFVANFGKGLEEFADMEDHEQILDTIEWYDIYLSKVEIEYIEI